ncbi:MAG: hypothetical protein K9H64_15790 [Bacteroidales bacterium]|nr:hypothetical protein [Bacteroidales bacterium]MCF8457430.1 hypothetical protein [Bacteroidales bacterium]
MGTIYDKEGKLKIPEGKKESSREEKPDVISYCFCPNGHNLVSPKVKIRNYDGILLKVKHNNKTGLLGLSPVCGCKMKMSIDLDLIDGEKCDMFCPECDAKLPVFNTCPSCGGDLITLFLDERTDYTYCIGICNKAGCPHSEIRKGDELRVCAILENWN